MSFSNISSSGTSSSGGGQSSITALNNSSVTRTITQTEIPNTNTTSSDHNNNIIAGGTLILQAGSSSSRTVQWDNNVIDNEGLGRKKSKSKVSKITWTFFCFVSFLFLSPSLIPYYKQGFFSFFTVCFSSNILTFYFILPLLFSFGSLLYLS